jgi:multiple sugar transport system substrate-binding protein
VRVDYQSWEDLRPRTTVEAQVGSGPDLALGWLDDPHTLPEKLVDRKRRVLIG